MFGTIFLKNRPVGQKNNTNNKFVVGQELWVVGSDKINAGKNAEDLLEKSGYPRNTSFELIKVNIKFINIM
jgi:hypothetical protein